MTLTTEQKALKHLRSRLARERRVYGLIEKPSRMVAAATEKPNVFEIMVFFVKQFPRTFEVRVYEKSYKVYEV